MKISVCMDKCVFSNFLMKMLAQVGEHIVPIADPVFWRLWILLNTKLFSVSIKHKNQIITFLAISIWDTKFNALFTAFIPSWSGILILLMKSEVPFICARNYFARDRRKRSTNVENSLVWHSFELTTGLPVMYGLRCSYLIKGGFASCRVR